jgi:hypothetical protein
MISFYLAGLLGCSQRRDLFRLQVTHKLILLQMPKHMSCENPAEFPEGRVRFICFFSNHIL